MHKRLMEFLNKQKILYFKQYGFCKSFPIGHAMINLLMIHNLFMEFLLTYKRHLIQFITTI